MKNDGRLAAGLLWAAVWVYVFSLWYAGAHTPGYSHARQLISELGEVGAPYAGLWRANLAFAGLATMGLARALHRSVGGGGVWGPVFIATIGVGLALGAVFQCDPACVPRTFSGWTHILTSVPASVCAIAGPFVLARRFARDPAWRGHARVSRIFGAVAVLTILAAFFVFPSCGLQGAGQRLATLAQLAWLAWLAALLLRAPLPRAAPAERA